MLRDDALGAAREGAAESEYLAAFDAMQAAGGNRLIVGVEVDDIVATYQLTFISGLSLRAALRAQLESVRVASDRRGQGLGHALIADAEARSRAAGCALMQLTMNSTREQTNRFYQQLGFVPSHIGFKRDLT
jgi:GNAT superfamily N-acetyltransferase